MQTIDGDPAYWGNIQWHYSCNVMLWVKYLRDKLSVEMSPSRHVVPPHARVFTTIPMTAPGADQQSLKDEIADLERRLRDAKAQLSDDIAVTTVSSPADDTGILSHTVHCFQRTDSKAALHALLLLADSALPLGSFAFSSGLESYLAHHKLSPPSASQLPSFNTFLRLSLSTLASTALPYVLAGYREPWEIETLDNDFDASTPCTVARRASVAQGRALLAVWDRSFKPQYSPKTARASGDNNGISSSESAIQALAAFSAALRSSEHLNAHLAPLWGLVTKILSVPLHDAAYLFLFSHARTVISAAVRASVMGPYQAQAVLASSELQDRIRGLVDEGWRKTVQDAGQSVPVMDLWVGRHEKLYSRIFNS
jgi:urease accessory protein